ncbi:MAG: hypothetical protein COC24_006255 [Alphaproteobacteria bacterium]|nr:hypothetical protein [Alphaproteobacteria bacterium]
MKTPTHAVVGFVTAKLFGFGRGQTIACVLGACLADLPLMLAYVYFLMSCFWRHGHYDAAYIKALMDGIYFEQSWLLVAHNMFHSPVSIGYLSLICLICCVGRSAVRRILLAYLAGSFSHSILDIISHMGDGPLLLWPLDDELRMMGLFSHWFMGMPLLVEGVAVILLFGFYVGSRVARV